MTIEEAMDRMKALSVGGWTRLSGLDYEALRLILDEVERLKGEREDSDIKRAFDQHLAGCAIFEEDLKAQGMAEDDGVWTNVRAVAAEARAKRLEGAIRETLDNYLDVLPIHVRLILQEAAPKPPAALEPAP